METDLEETVISIELPDLEETQIWENSNDTREVALYLATKDGKVDGAEHAPFILPYRWTFNTLKNCIEDYIVNRLGYENKSIAQIYYKRSGKSRGVVAINSDKDIPSLLGEYPLKTLGGKRSRKSVMVLAVDLSQESEKITTPKHEKKYTNVGQQTPRRSPRLLERSSTSTTKVTPSYMDVFLFVVSKSGKGEPKLSKTASVIHNVSKDITLVELKELVRARESQTFMFVPVSGFYWLRKGTKQMVDLKNEADFRHCKDEYKDSGIRIACSTIDINSGSSGASANNKQTKRNLQYSMSTDADSRELELVDAVTKPKQLKTSNDVWNDIHVDLVRDLEKKGTISRYSVRHLKLWTELIVEGKSAGLGDEPDWEEFIDVIGVPPKRRSSEKMSTPQSQAETSTDQLLKAMMIQNQRNTEVFQTSLLAILANQQLQSPVANSTFNPKLLSSTPRSTSDTSSTNSSFFDYVEREKKKNVAGYSSKECIHFLEANDLSKFVPKFIEIDVDGPLLASLCHPSFGHSILEGMGINRDDGEVIVQVIEKEMHS